MCFLNQSEHWSWRKSQWRIYRCIHLTSSWGSLGYWFVSETRCPESSCPTDQLKFKICHILYTPTFVYMLAFKCWMLFSWLVRYLCAIMPLWCGIWLKEHLSMSKDFTWTVINLIYLSCIHVNLNVSHNCIHVLHYYFTIN